MKNITKYMISNRTLKWNDIQAMFYFQSEITASEYFCVRNIK